VDALADFQPLALSLAIGLLVGLERGWHARDAAAGGRVAGFRTFGLLGLLGGVAALLPQAFGAVLLLGATAMLAAGYWRATAGRDRSATSAIAGLLTLALGAFAGAGNGAAALAGTAVMVLILSQRHRLHDWLRGIDADEIDAASRFAIVALVVLPLMPDRAMGPLDAWNPRQLWFVVVLVLGLSFAGYVAAKRLGAERGLLVTAAAGALVSSTAVTASYARRLREPGPAEGALVAGISIAQAVMFARVLLLTGILAFFALPWLLASMLPALIVQLGLAAFAVRRAPGGTADGAVKLGNPLDFRPALLLAAFVAVLAVASRWAMTRFGDAGVGALLLLTGVADVDAAVITLAGLPAGTLTARRAGVLLALPVIANSVLKAGLAVAIAPNRRGWRAAAPLLASAAVAGGGIAAVLLA
jgi:uncharacterized membrane protein (DUF4010 family)